MLGVVPGSFARAFAAGLGLGMYRPPVALPAPDIAMYWHSRHDRSPAHRWIRTQVLEVLGGVLERQKAT
jgi:DNA-binding transcriptional LysR family regulator